VQYTLFHREISGYQKLRAGLWLQKLAAKSLPMASGLVLACKQNSYGWEWNSQGEVSTTSQESLATDWNRAGENP
jgi:hypothetical protein